MEGKYVVYAKTDAQSRIVVINSSAFIADVTDWTKIDEGVGDKYHHAQGNYFALPLTNADGTHNYKLVDGAPVKTTAKEKANELAAMPQPAPTPQARIDALESALLALMEGNNV